MIDHSQRIQWTCFWLPSHLYFGVEFHVQVLLQSRFYERLLASVININTTTKMAQLLSKNSFYGSKKRSKTVNIKAKIERRVREHRLQPVPHKYKQRLCLSSSWEIFYKQGDAFAYLRRFHHQDLHIFSFESKIFFEHHGQRLYLVTTYDQFWHYYSQLTAEKRNYYEVIPEGAVCHLYFDLEFNRECNPVANGSKMVDTFIKVIQCHLRQQFNITCSRSDVLQLDSSSDVKFSQHLIFHLPMAAFKDNINAGHFVKRVCQQLHAISGHTECDRNSDLQNMYEDYKICKEDIRNLYVLNKENEKTIFCDTGVYTKNRNFRLYLSSKLNKKTPLVLAEENECLSSSPGNVNHKKIFLHSLVANVQYETRMHILTDEPFQQSTSRNSQRALAAHSPTAEGYQHSPYLEIDTFIESVITQSAMRGNIRRWTYFHQGELLVYDISHNRWCHNVGRQHKSNNIMLLVDIRRGVYYQKCHDPDCKAIDYKSEEWKLPDNTLPGYHMQDEMSDTCSTSNQDDNSGHFGSLTSMDFNRYFDSDDQEILEAMKRYELDVNVQPEWFCDCDDGEFLEEGRLTKSNIVSSGGNSNTDDILTVSKNKNDTPSSVISESKIEDSGYYDTSYVDPAWFDEEFG